MISCHGSTSMASLHISSVLRWSDTNLSMDGMFCTTSEHISCLLYWSGTSANKGGILCPALLHILFVFRLSGTSANKGGILCTTPLQIPCIFRLSGTSANELGSFSTALSQTLEIYFSRCNKTYPITFLINSIILFIPLGPAKGQLLWTEHKSTFFLMTLHFSITYSLLILCMRRMSRVRASLIFCMHKISWHLNQSFIAEYSPLIFVWLLSV